MRTYDANVRSLAERIALVRAIGAAASFGVIYFDDSVPHLDTPDAVLMATLAAAAFTMYAAFAYFGLTRRWFSLTAYEVASPLLDVVFAAFLIAATDGYRSPFNVWMIFAVLGTAVTGRHWLPLATVALGVIALLLTAFAPQDIPLSFSTLIVRTAFLFGIAVIVAFIGSLMANQARELSAAARRAERQKVRDELHDTHIQTLAAIGLRADAAQMMLERGQTPKEDLAEIRRLTSLAAAEVRLMLVEDQESEESSPQVLRRIVSERWPGAATVELEEVSVSPDAWLAIEMLVREGLNNARTHSGAKGVHLSLAQRGGRVVCHLKDDGRGLKEGATEGYGLGRIRQLVEAAGGTFSCQNGEDSGLALTATFPPEDAKDRSTDR